MKIVSDRACSLCGCTSYNYLFDKREYKFIRCVDCGLATVTPLPSSEILEDLYEEDYFVTGSEEKGYADYIANYITKPFIQKRKEMVLKLKGGGKLLDVGSAHGFFLKAVEGHFDCMGVESSKFASSYGRDKLGLNILTNSIEDAELPLGSFDIITCWSIIDHIKDPVAFFTRINQLLKPGGIFASNIANVDSLRFHLNKENWKPIRPPEHLYYYTIKSMRGLLDKTGYSKMVLTGKNEIGIGHVFNNPDLNIITHEQHHFNLSKLQYLRMYLFGLFCLFSEKTGLFGYTVGSNLDVYAYKK